MSEQDSEHPQKNECIDSDSQKQVSNNHMHKIMISCQRTTELVSLSYERKLNTTEKFQLYSHLAMCKGCRAFAKNSKMLSQMMKAHKDNERNRPDDSEI